MQCYRMNLFLWDDRPMKSSWFSFFGRALMLLAVSGVALADGRPGAVEWSDGHQVTGAISLTAGKDLHVFTTTSQVSIALDEVKEIRFTPEKEEMWEGFYFPNAGQATQVKTGDVYPIRYLQTQVTLGNGQVVEGHLFTTVLYVEPDDGQTEKVVLMAKQTGANGQKLSDLIYPTAIVFDGGAASTASAEINLTEAGFVPLHPPVIVQRPDLAFLPMQQTDGKSIWTVPTDDPGKIFFSVQAADGIHVTWPMGGYVGNQVMKPSDTPPPVPLADVDPTARIAVKDGLRDMQDFYDTRTLLGCFTGDDVTDIFSLVMMKRVGPTNAYAADKIPWSLVILRWKYDADQKKATLLNRALLVMGRTVGNSPLPTVFKQPELVRDISGNK
jgi:hypothetical protein